MMTTDELLGKKVRVRDDEDAVEEYSPTMVGKDVLRLPPLVPERVLRASKREKRSAMRVKRLYHPPTNPAAKFNVGSTPESSENPYALDRSDFDKLTKSRVRILALNGLHKKGQPPLAYRWHSMPTSPRRERSVQLGHIAPPTVYQGIGERGYNKGLAAGVVPQLYSICRNDRTAIGKVQERKTALLEKYVTRIEDSFRRREEHREIKQLQKNILQPRCKLWIEVLFAFSFISKLREAEKAQNLRAKMSLERFVIPVIRRWLGVTRARKAWKEVHDRYVGGMRPPPVGAISSLANFSILPSEKIEELSKAFRPLVVLQGGFLYQQGDMGNDITYLERGRIHFLLRTASRTNKKITLSNTIRTGETRSGRFMGDITLRERALRNTSAYCAEDCFAWVLAAKDFEKVLSNVSADTKERLFAVDSGAIDDDSLRRMAPITEADVKRTYLFGGWPDEALTDVVAKLRPMCIDRKGVLYRRGDVSQSLYFVVVGTILLKRQGHAAMHLAAGSVVGEVETITKVNRCFKAVSTEHSVLYELHRHDLIQVSLHHAGAMYDTKIKALSLGKSWDIPEFSEHHCPYDDAVNL